MIVAFTVSGRRLPYLQRTLSSWARARGSGSLKVGLFVEPPWERGFSYAVLYRWIATVFPGSEVFENKKRLGCNKNTFQAMDWAMSLGEFGVLAEEDIEVADDTVEYFAWAQRYRDDIQVGTVHAHVKASSAAEDQVLRAPWFSPLVWGTWPDRWEDLSRNWPNWYQPWDYEMRTRVMGRQLHGIYPARSRALHIGEQSLLSPSGPGERASYWHKQALSTCYSPHYDRQAYREDFVPDVTLY